MSAREFQVYIYTPDPNKPKECSVDWPVGTLWKGASDTDSQTVAWFSDDGSAYKIDFGQGSQSDSNKNPFKDSDGPNYFKVPAGSFRKSGPLRHDASGYYSFAIQNSQGDNCKDPSDPGYYVK